MNILRKLYRIIKTKQLDYKNIYKYTNIILITYIHNCNLIIENLDIFILKANILL